MKSLKSVTVIQINNPTTLSINFSTKPKVLLNTLFKSEICVFVCLVVEPHLGLRPEAKSGLA